MRDEILRKIYAKITKPYPAVDTLTAAEAPLYYLMNPPKPLNLFFHTGAERRFRDAMDKFTFDEAIFAFRAETREPNEVFNSSLSAYSYKRVSKGNAKSLAWFLCCYYWMGYKEALPLYMFTYLPGCTGASGDMSFAIGDMCGQNMYRAKFVSGKGALALSRSFTGAKPYYNPSEKFWRYIVFLPDGYIDFDAYCKQAETHLFDITSAYPVEEIFPNGKQKITSEYIFAAVDENGMIEFNDKFIFADSSLKTTCLGLVLKAIITRQQDLLTDSDLKQLFSHKIKQYFERRHKANIEVNIDEVARYTSMLNF